MRDAIAAAITRTGSTAADKRRRTHMRRWGNFCAKAYADLCPRDVRPEHVAEFRDLVRTLRPVPRSGWSESVLRVLREGGVPADAEAVRELRRVAERDYLAISPPPDLPEQMQRHLAVIGRDLAEQVALRQETGGLEGIGQQYARTVSRTLAQFLHFVLAHNAAIEKARQEGLAATEAEWPLDFNYLFNDVEPIRRFLTEGSSWTTTGRAAASVSGPTRERRRSELRTCYHILHDLQKIGAPDFLARVLEATGRHRSGRKSGLGGRPAREITALEASERRAVYATLDRRFARAQSVYTRISGEASAARAGLALRAVLLAYALWELCLWSGMRLATLCTLDMQHLRRLKTGSYVFGQANFKARHSPDLDDQWVAPRAIRRLRDLLEFDGLRLVLEGDTPEKAWGPPVHLGIGDKYGQKRLAEPRSFHPALRNQDGKALTTKEAARILGNLLHAAGCHTSEPRVIRHTMASMYLNEFGRSVEEVKAIGRWKSDKVVYRHYAKRQKDAVYEEFDALSEDVLRLEPGATNVLVTRVAASLQRFLATLSDGHGGEQGITSLWNGLVDALDTMAAADPSAIAPSKAIVLSPQDWELLDREVMVLTDRKQSLRKIARRVLADGPRVGLRVPVIPDDADGADGASARET